MNQLLFLFGMIKLFDLVFRFASNIDPKLFEGAAVHLCQDDGGMGFAPFKPVQLLQGQSGILRGNGTDGKSDQDLVGMESWIVVTKMIDLEVLNGFYDGRRNKILALVDACQLFESV